MQYLIASSRNHSQQFYEDGDSLEPCIEVVLTTFDRHRQFAGARLTTVEVTSTVRLGITPAQARELADELATWADESEQLSKRVTLTPKPKP